MTSAATLPNAPVVDLGSNIFLQPPLSRCGHGPGLIIIRPSGFADCQSNNTSLDPEPLQKWAEESYAVAQITLDSVSSADEDRVADLARTALNGLRSREEVDDKDSIGLISTILSSYHA